jgi:hypothetical protein
LTPLILVPPTVTGHILGALLVLLLLLPAAEHVLEEVELGLGDRHHQHKGA